jgi:hypothetical protein
VLTAVTGGSAQEVAGCIAAMARKIEDLKKDLREVQ